MRRCCQCHAENRVLAVQGDVEGATENTVTVELRYRENEQVSAAERRRGWQYKSFQGRHAMIRFICRVCLIQADEMDRDATRVRKAHLRMEQEGRGVDNVYAIYNEEYV